MALFLEQYKKRILIGGGVLIIIILLIVLGARHNGNDVKKFTVTTQDVVEQVELAGKVESNDFAELGFEVSGKITQVYAKVGDEVQRGQLLVRLDTGELQADLLDAQAALEIKRNEINNASINLDDVIEQQDTLVASAKRKLLSTNLEPIQNISSSLDAPVISGTYTGEPGEYKISIERQATYTGDTYVIRTFGLENTKGEIEYGKTHPLGTYGLYIELPEDSESYIDTIWYLAIPNKQGSGYTANLNAYEEALTNRTVAIRDAERELAQNNTENSIAQAELKQAQAKVSRIQAQINQRIIRAPFDGVIAGIEAEQGEIASAGAKIISIVSGGDFEVELDVPEIDVAKLEVGNKVAITLDAFGNRTTWAGEIIAISQAERYVDGVPVYETRVAFLEPDDRVRSGLRATVSIVTGIQENVLAVPIEFIERDADGSFVNLLIDADASEVDRRDIVVGLRGSDGFVEIIEGLQAGDIVSTDEASI